MWGSPSKGLVLSVREVASLFDAQSHCGGFRTLSTDLGGTMAFGQDVADGIKFLGFGSIGNNAGIMSIMGIRSWSHFGAPRPTLL